MSPAAASPKRTSRGARAPHDSAPSSLAKERMAPNRDPRHSTGVSVPRTGPMAAGSRARADREHRPEPAGQPAHGLEDTVHTTHADGFWPRTDHGWRESIGPAGDRAHA